MKLYLIFFTTILTISNCFSLDFNVQNLEYQNSNSPNISFSNLSLGSETFQLQVKETFFTSYWEEEKLVFLSENERIETSLSPDMFSLLPFTFLKLNNLNFNENDGINVSTESIDIPILEDKVISLEEVILKSSLDLSEIQLSINYIPIKFEDFSNGQGPNIKMDGVKNLLLNKSGNSFSFSTIVDGKIDFTWEVEGQIEISANEIAIHIEKARMADISAKNYTMIVLMGIFPDHEVQGDTIYIKLK